MTTTERLASLVMLVPGGIWAGVIVMFAIERVDLWARMPIEQYVVDFRRSLRRADPFQPVLAVITFLGSLVFALASGGGLATTFAWVGAGLVLTVIVLSVALPERINAQFRRLEEGEAPANPSELRARWRTLHLIRTGPAVAALVALVFATTFA